jgi:hypothetical protein
MKKYVPPQLVNNWCFCIILIFSSTVLLAQAPANDNCANAAWLTPELSCINGTSSLTGQTISNSTYEASAIAASSCGAGNSQDVWYRFTANSTRPTITLSNMGTSLTGGPGANRRRIQLLSGTCGSFTEVGCVNGATLTPGTDLIVGNVYYIRIHKGNNTAPIGATWGFDICITSNCITTAILIANQGPGSCINGTNQLSGNLVGATGSGIPTTACGGTADDERWYQFTAAYTRCTIRLSSIGTNIAVNGTGLGGSVKLEVFSNSNNTCGGLVSLACGTATGVDMEALPTGLIQGNTYFIRVYSTNNIALGSNATYNICITNPAWPPSNDNCSGAETLFPSTNCTAGGATPSKINSNLGGATNSGIAATCGGTPDDDVWFRFTATNTNHVLSILDTYTGDVRMDGTGLGGLPVLEVFSSSNNLCTGTFTSIACGINAGNEIVAYANGLTIGNTYFARVYSTNNISLGYDGYFGICVQTPNTPTLSFGKSFINITKGLNGGTVEPGDVLEIRASVVVQNTTIIDSCSFADNIPANTTYIPGSLYVLTNEGKIYKSFTDASGDDAGSITGSSILINIGYNTFDNPATPFRRGRLSSRNRPSITSGPAGTSTCVMTLAYRIRVNPATPLNTILSLGGGNFSYSNYTSPTTVLNHTFNNNNVIVYTDNGLCINSTGVNVLNTGLAGDYNGTFGSGNFRTRNASPNVPVGYTYTHLNGDAPDDFNYTITNNTSNNVAGYTTSNNWPKPDNGTPRHRIFKVFDIIGDHTGATNPLLGNTATDTVGGNTGGYMLLVNASYNLDTAFKYPITGLCPNTYYELSAWIRNISSLGGSDSLLHRAAENDIGYIPTAPGDSSGVKPNLSFSINGINHYTTGDIQYTGQWIKKGFVFRTEAGQTNIEFAITNNAQGGGGNDWALDDISLATCTPNLNLIPSGNAQVCLGNQVDLNTNVISFFNNYVYYQWQVSRDNGVTWTDTLAMGTGTPVWNGTNYVYNVAFPSFIGNASQHFVQYRIRVATTPANLASGCSFFNTANIIIMVNSCLWVLKTDLLSFTAQLNNKQALLNWRVTNETESTIYEIERSTDGIQFSPIGTIKAAGNNTYTFTDPLTVSGTAFYRIKVKDGKAEKLSKIVLLSTTEIPFSIVSVGNPFSNKLSFVASSPASSNATISIIDYTGKSVKLWQEQLASGANFIEINGLSNLANGNYILQVATPSGVKTKRVIKTSN